MSFLQGFFRVDLFHTAAFDIAAAVIMGPFEEQTLFDHGRSDMARDVDDVTMTTGINLRTSTKMTR